MIPSIWWSWPIQSISWSRGVECSMFTFHSWSGVRCHVECMKLERTVEAARVMSRLTWHHPQSTRVLRHNSVPCTHVPRVDTLCNVHYTVWQPGDTMFGQGRPVNWFASFWKLKINDQKEMENIYHLSTNLTSKRCVVSFYFKIFYNFIPGLSTGDIALVRTSWYRVWPITYFATDQTSKHDK